MKIRNRVMHRSFSVIAPVVVALASACSSKPAPPITTSEVDQATFYQRCISGKADCDGKAVIWKANFWPKDDGGSKDDKIITLETNEGTLVHLKDARIDISNLRSGAEIRFRGYLDISSGGDVRVEHVQIDHLESDDATIRRVHADDMWFVRDCMPHATDLFVAQLKSIERRPFEHTAATVKYIYGDPDGIVPKKEMKCEYFEGKKQIYSYRNGWEPDKEIFDQTQDHKTDFTPEFAESSDSVQLSANAQAGVMRASGPANGAAADAAAVAVLAKDAAKEAEEVSAKIAASANGQDASQAAKQDVNPNAASVPAAATATQTSEAVTPTSPSAPSTSSDPHELTKCANTLECVKLMMTSAKLENLADAMSAAAQLDTLPKPSRGDRSSARKLNQLGLNALNLGNAPDAVNLFVQAMQTDPTDVEIISNLVFAYQQSGDLIKSEDTAVAALALNPRRTSTWAPLAATLAKEHRLDQAAEAMWLAYQFSGDKQKTMQFIDSKLASESNPDAVKMYATSKTWFEKNEKPDVLQETN